MKKTASRIISRIRLALPQIVVNEPEDVDKDSDS